MRKFTYVEPNHLKLILIDQLLQILGYLDNYSFDMFSKKKKKNSLTSIKVDLIVLD